MIDQNHQDSIKLKNKDFNQSKNLVYAGYLFVVAATTLAWNTYFKGSFAGFSVPSYLGMLGFGFMWMHYFAAWLKSNFEPELDISRSTRVTQWVVLAAIIAHPTVIALRLEESGLGLPPFSYQRGFGGWMILFVALGALALCAYLLFEFREVIKKRPSLWRRVMSFNDLAMILIIFHGAKLGFVTQNTFFKFVWLGYGLSLLYFYYDKYIIKERMKKYAVPFIVVLFALGVGIFSLLIGFGENTAKDNEINNGEPDKSSVKNAPVGDPNEVIPITLADLSRADGLDGRRCWVAIDGVVYDASDNKQWQNGKHTPSNGLASCGKDLSEVIGQSPHGKDVLRELVILGDLE